MSKKTFHYIVKCGWLLLALMPLIVYMIAARTSEGGASLQTFNTIMTEKLNFITTDNIIYTTLKAIFGTEGIMPILQDGLLIYAAYFCIVEIVHLCVDVLVFIPRLAHEWLEGFTRRIS